MIEVRLWGDPFAPSREARALCNVLQQADAAGVACGLALTAMRTRPRARQGEREVPLDDGAGGTLRVRTDATEAEIARALAAARRAVVAWAPILVFGDADDEAQAGFEFPQACAVLRGDADLDSLWHRLRIQPASPPGDGGADLCSSGIDAAALTQTPDLADTHRVLLLAHVGVDRGDDRGVEPAVVALAALQGERPLQVTVATSTAAAAGMRARIVRAGLVADVVCDPCLDQVLRAAAVVLVPSWSDRALLAQALASGRAVVAPRCGPVADLLPDGAALPVGGRTRGGIFTPDTRHLLAQLRRAVADPVRTRQIGLRGRVHALMHARRRRPLPPLPAPHARAERPSIVLEAPVFEVSSSSLLTDATARALLRRGHVDLFVVPRGEHQLALADVVRRAPEVLARCVRQAPADADLWLATGWPLRPDRPAGARTFAVRIDWEYGALPVGLSPLVPSEADVVVVHSRAVEAMVTGSGRARDSIALVPHGVDSEVFHPRAAPLAEVAAWKRGRAAILFAGGLIWRKGVDLLLKALLQMPAPLRAQVCLVIKPMGAQTSYRGYELGELVHRFRAAGAVDTLVVERDLTAVEMAGLYTACDVVAHPYRGEGFGLPVLEALACGVPVIVTAGGSTDDFAWGGGCLRVAATRRDVELPEPCLSQPWVLEPDLASLGAALARAVHERSSLKGAAQAAATAVAMRSSWDAAAARLEAIATDAWLRRRAAISTPQVAQTPAV